MQVEIMVQPSEAKYYTNAFWNTFSTTNKDYFTVTSTFTQISTNNTYANDVVGGAFFNIIYSATLSKKSISWKRNDIISEISNFGGIMGLITLIFNQLLGPIANFQQDLELSRILYTSTKDPDAKKNGD